MLLITRRTGEKIIIGGNIVIQVVEVSGSTVRLGIDAPRAVQVYREELWEAVKRENEAAAGASPDSLPKLAPRRAT
jgi:carbon storage regulator